MTSIHTYFGLSYANYLTVPRVALDAMPSEWQAKFTALLEELDETIDWRPERGQQYRCTLHNVNEEYRIDGEEEEYWGEPIYDDLSNYKDHREIEKRVKQSEELDEEYFETLFSDRPGSITGGIEGAKQLADAYRRAGMTASAEKLDRAVAWAQENPSRLL